MQRSVIYIPVGVHDVLIDRVDYQWVRMLSLSIGKGGYVVSSSRFMLHRMVLGLIPNDNQMIDHINGNKLDNRRKNLRICNSQENVINSKPFKKQKHSHYKGVSKDSKKALAKPWQASIRYKNKAVYLGYWETEEKAALAYDKAVRFFYPAIPKHLNFPNKTFDEPVPNIDYDRHTR